MSHPECYTRWSNSPSTNWWACSLNRRMWDLWLICKPRDARRRRHYFRVSRVIDG